MWLLSTDRAELHFFSTIRAAQAVGFAILSHVWGDQEQTFRDTEAIRLECAGFDINPRDRSSEKVHMCCIIAERYGHKWIWNDTCCIDKTSSSELSEAINSMYTLYECAEVCYAYLEDVPPDCRPSLGADAGNAFVQSRWFRRGWTLQELIAPAEVVFLSRDWDLLGTKAALAGLLQHITRIPQTVLTHVEEVSQVSVARRMSWAAGRMTTRPEDEAYSLMGIFDVNMPTIYGEGRKAFQRLQEEIMRRTPDTTLFAWEPASKVEEELDGLFAVNRESPIIRYGVPGFHLFAVDPTAFVHSFATEFAPNSMSILVSAAR